MTGQRKVYANPPIEEAIVQFQFSEPLAWSVATPGLVFSALEPDYPSEPGVQQEVAAEFKLDEKGAAGNLSLADGAQRVVYLDRSGKRLVILGRDHLAISSRRPYEGWESLQHRMERLLQIWPQAVPLPGANGVALRYVNRIVIPDPPFDSEDYFNIPIITARQGTASFQAFLQRVQSVLDDNVVLSMTFASLGPDGGGFAVLLDLELRQEFQTAKPLSEAIRAARTLKEIENEEFESLIKPRTRGLFT